MIDNSFRNILPRYTHYLLAFYSRIGATPNQITVAGMLVGIGASILVAFDCYLVAIFTWWLGRLLDGTDGIYARATNQTSAFGAYLDITCDMLAYGAMIIGFAISHSDFYSSWIAILFLYVLCITTALALGHAEEKFHVVPNQNRGMRLGAGLAEGGETGIAYTLFCLFPGYIGKLSSIWIVILIVTVVSRSLLARKVLEDH